MFTSKITNNKRKYNNEHETEYLHHEAAQFHSYVVAFAALGLFGRSILPNVRATTGSNIPNSKENQNDHITIFIYTCHCETLP